MFPNEILVNVSPVWGMREFCLHYLLDHREKYFSFGRKKSFIKSEFSELLKMLHHSSGQFSSVVATIFELISVILSSSDGSSGFQKPAWKPCTCGLRRIEMEPLPDVAG